MAARRTSSRKSLFAGRVVAITGASRGLGQIIAKHFAENGASLILGARSAGMLSTVARQLARKSQENQKIIALPLDVADENSIRQWGETIRKTFRRVDVLVNCAGVPGPRGPLDHVDWSEWKQAVDVNLLGLVLVTKHVLPLMRRRGKIINISGGGATKPLPHLSAYAATKAAVVRFTETLAHELRTRRIDVNAVAPGVLATRMVRQFLELDETILGSAYVREVKRQLRNPRPAMDRAAQLCLYLASPASDGITGRLISAVWDPWPNLAAHREDLAKTDVYTLRRIEPRDRGFSWGGRS